MTDEHLKEIQTISTYTLIGPQRHNIPKSDRLVFDVDIKLTYIKYFTD